MFFVFLLSLITKSTMMLPKAVKRGINEYFASQDLLDFQIRRERAAGGGDINEAALIETTEGDFFVKWNDAEKFPGMFEAEARGLNLLIDTGEIAVPRPLHYDEIRGVGFLLMEAVRSAPKAPNFWFDFGTRLAEMHKHSSEHFGLDHDNYIGSLKQNNDYRDNWADFFVEMRLEKQLRLARDYGRAGSDISSLFSYLFPKIETLFPEEKPALVHGDLWSGNFMTGKAGQPVIIDPAVYYGHREMDLGMSRLFGGFDEEFYSAYHSSFPLESGWQERTEICNLYPLMVHVNLFGGSYISQVVNILKHFT